MEQFDRGRSLQQLDGQDRGEPTFRSHLVRECRRFRRVPLCNFTAEDLRIAIGQNVGLEYLVPLALERLDDDPFTPGAYYPCDLLVSVLRSDMKFWQRHAKLREPLVTIAERAIGLFPTKPDIASEVVTKAVIRAYSEFMKRQTPAT